MVWLGTAVEAKEAGGGDGIAWELPTENRALFRGELNKFFQPTISRRAISGRFGFVRTSQPEPAKIFEHFHKGIDIRPVTWDEKGEPKDVVRAAADGEVVRVNLDAKISDYGKQVIVRHFWDEQPVYTIYGHLAAIGVEKGQKVKAGDALGVMGWTGPGLVRERAHLHFEIALELNEKFAEWVEAAQPGRGWQPNRHGEWNGLNLMGIDPIPLLQATQAGKPMRWREAWEQQPGGLIVRVPPFQGRPTWLQWVAWPGRDVAPPAWDLEMTPWGLPLRMKVGSERVNEPELRANPGTRGEGKYYGRGLVQADGKGGMKLSKFGRQTVEMMFFTGEEKVSPTPGERDALRP